MSSKSVWIAYSGCARRIPGGASAINTEAKYLMLRHAFEVLGCIRVELKTDVLNERSRRAIERPRLPCSTVRADRQSGHADAFGLRSK